MVEVAVEQSSYRFRLFLYILVLQHPAKSSNEHVNNSLIITATATKKSSFGESSHVHNMNSPPEIRNLKCWEAIVEAHVNTSSVELSDCSKCCRNFMITDRLEHWLKLSSCDLDTAVCLTNYDNLREKVTQNLFWLTTTEDILVYVGNSTDVILTWDYLTDGEKTLESLIYIINLTAIIVTLFGNGLVIATIIFTSIKYKTLWMTRVTLAITDILKGIFIMGYAIDNVRTLMVSNSGNFILNKTQQPNLFPGTQYAPLFIRHGYSVFCGFLFGVTTVMSLQCQGWLAMERLLLCSSKRFNSIMSKRNVKFANIFMWIVGISLPLIILYGGDSNKGKVYFDPVTKFPLLLASGNGTSASYVSFVMMMIYIVLLFLMTTTASVKSISLFNANATKQLAETMRYSSKTQAKQQVKHNLRILKTMKMMTVLYLISVTPQFLLLFSGVKKARIIYFFFWWLFILSSSWNWYLFNLRGQYFCDNLAQLLLKIPRLPDHVRLRLEKRLLPPSISKVEWGTIWQDLEDEIEKKKQLPMTSEVV